MTKTRFACRLGALLALVATTLAAQTNVTDWNIVKALSTGTDVRIAAGSRTVSGKIDRVTDDTMAVSAGKGQEVFTQQDVTQVSVRKKGHRARNALIGLGAGAGTGLGIGLATQCSSFCILSNGAVTAALTVVGVLAGALVGAVIPTGGWREIYKK